MIALRVQLNGGEPVTAGASGRDTFSVMAMSRAIDARYRPKGMPPTDLTLYIGGLRRTFEGTRGTFEWLDRQLRVGDEIAIRVVAVDEADISPVARERTIAEVIDSGEREELAYLIRKYGVP